jgi:hypothetical protein
MKFITSRLCSIFLKKCLKSQKAQVLTRADISYIDIAYSHSLKFSTQYKDIQYLTAYPLLSPDQINVNYHGDPLFIKKINSQSYSPAPACDISSLPVSSNTDDWDPSYSPAPVDDRTSPPIACYTKECDRSNSKALSSDKPNFPISFGSEGWDQLSDWLVQDYVPANSVGNVIGESQDMKTFLMLEMAGCIATGLNFADLPTSEGLVFYVAGEGAKSIPKRLKGFEKRHNVSIGQNIVLISKSVLISEKKQRDNLKALILSESKRQNKKPAMLVLDTFSHCSAGIEENHAGQVALYLHHCSELASELSLTVINVHHNGKSGKFRGSSALVANVDFSLETKRLCGKNRIANRLTIEKSKDGETNIGHEFELAIVDIGINDNTGKPVTTLVVNKATLLSKKKMIELSFKQIDKDKTLVKEILHKTGNWVSQGELINAFAILHPEISKPVIEKNVSIACKSLKEDGSIESMKNGRSNSHRLTSIIDKVPEDNM